MIKKKVKSKESTTFPVDQEISAELVDQQTRFFEDCIGEIFEERKDFFLAGTIDRFKALVAAAKERTEQVVDQNWTEIDSLSKLRAVVGGRFENLKAKWLSAGFPLKESKGAELSDFKLSSQGWVELSTWISNQGFEVRLCDDKSKALFEIKQK